MRGINLGSHFDDEREVGEIQLKSREEIGSTKRTSVDSNNGNGVGLLMISFLNLVVA